jgi:hypothetical protein
MAGSDYYETVRAKLLEAEGVRGGVDKEELFWMVIDGVATVLDAVTPVPFGHLNTAVQSIYSTITAKGKTEGAELTPNPWFIFNGHDEGGYAVTQKYLRGRIAKGLGATAVAVAGELASGATYVDVGGILQHGNATGSTAIHIHKLRAIAAGHRQSRTITDWLDVVIKMKAIKTGMRGSQLVVSCIPVPMVGTIAGVVGAAAKVGVKLTMTKVCLATSADIHWRAFQEQAISGAVGGGRGAKVGPASRIVYELFTRRGATRIFGKYDVDAMIREPAGWMAVYDKLTLI